MKKEEFSARLQELCAAFNEDLDLTRIDELSIMQRKVPYLHGKYLTLEMMEGDTLKRMENSLKKIERENSDYYLGRASDEFTQAKGVFPIRIDKSSDGKPKKGKVLNAELASYLDADKDVQAARLSVHRQKEIVRFLREKVDLLNNLSFHINNIIKWERRNTGNQD